MVEEGGSQTSIGISRGIVRIIKVILVFSIKWNEVDDSSSKYSLIDEVEVGEMIKNLSIERKKELGEQLRSSDKWV